MRSNGKVQDVDDFDIGYCCQAFITSSDRVRHVIFAITIACGVLFVGHRNATIDNWPSARLTVARQALETKVWEAGDCGNLTGLDLAACKWVKNWGLSSAEAVKGQITMLEHEFLQNVLVVRFPVLGISFDVNDLGYYGGLALLVLMLLLVFASSRQHENLFLALWKIRRLAAAQEPSPDEMSFKDNGNSRANLFYHYIAMAQHFTRPPTLARWWVARYSIMTYLLVCLPFFIQVFSYFHDLDSREFGDIISPERTQSTLNAELLTLLAILVLTIVVCFYTASNDRRWRSTFFRINPKCGRHTRVPWLVWVGIKEREMTDSSSCRPVGRLSQN